MTSTRRSLMAPIVVVVSLWLVGWVIVLGWPEGVMGGDLPVYYDRILAIESGGIPYVDPVFEHLPAVLVPLFAARLLSGFGSSFAFSVVFTILMALCLLATVSILSRVVDRPVGRRFLWLASPLVPLVVFRNDPWVTLLAVGALVPTTAGLVAGVAAVLAKGWPAVLALPAWFTNKRGRAIALAASAVVAGLLLFSPGFTATQQASGVHSETVAGSVIGLVRAVRGTLEVDVTTAAYLPVDSWAVWVGPLLAIPFLLAGVAAIRRDPHGLVAIGVLVGAVIIASRLFSTQYVLWVLPFLAASSIRAARVLGLVVSVASLAMILTWAGLFEGWGWWALAVTRNMLFLVLLLVMAVEGLRHRVLVAPSP